MIFLEQTVKQILREEGQILISLSDLGISWEDLEATFIGTYEQAKGYITTYDWVEDIITNTPTKKNFSHVKHITPNTYQNMQRFVPDLPGHYWEFNPYTKNMSTLMNMNFSLEVGKYATLEQLTYDVTFNNVKKGKSKRFTLPCTPTDELVVSIAGQIREMDVEISEVEYDTRFKNDYLDGSDKCPCKGSGKENALQIMGDINGSINLDTLNGNVTFTEDFDTITLTFLSKYVGIKELDLTCELFYKWFKSNVLMLIGSVKSQVDLSSAGLPFDFNADGLLDRAKELRTNVEQLKADKSHWSNF